MPRLPLNGPLRVSGDTLEHYRRGVGPATDYVRPGNPLPIGTPILAPFDGYLTHYGSLSADGGLGVALAGHGRVFHGQHLSSRRPSGAFREGDIIGLSGNTGRWTDGPHLHCYVIVEGLRMSFTEFMLTYGAPVLAGNGNIMSDLSENDKAWVRLAVRQEVGAAVATIPQGLTAEDKDWARLMVRQEIGGLR